MDTFLSDIDKKSLESDYEIEAKIKNITGTDWKILRDSLISKFPMEKTSAIDYYKDSIRYWMDNGVWMKMKKIRISDKFFTIGNIKVKISISKEEVEKEDVVDETWSLVRSKERESFLLENFSLDLTRVVEGGESKYEFEIEVIDPLKYDPVEFSQLIYQYTNILSNYRGDIISFCNYSISGGKSTRRDELDYKFGSRPRDLLKEDVVSKDGLLKGYSVSVKADGIPYYLVNLYSGSWLVSLKNEIELLESGKKERSIFIGELIDVKNLRKPINFSRVFFPFDTIFYEEKSVVEENYLKRSELMKNSYDRCYYKNGVRNLKVLEKKIFHLGKTSEEFFTNFAKCYEHRKEIIYNDDGYIFTPVDSPFKTPGQDRRGEVKNISVYPDLCKFKPIEKKSIDLLVREGKLYSFTGNIKKPKYIEVRGIDFILQEDTNLEGEIVEFFPDLSGKTPMLTPDRIRTDKVVPNKLPQVLETIKSYRERNPITERTFLQEDTVLMRHYQNEIKRDLIERIDGLVIDIGSGKGGDLAKYNLSRNIRKVIMVEPNEEYFSELKTRLSKIRGREKFFPVLGKGENYEKIVTAMRDHFKEISRTTRLTITFMITLSFFWSSNETLQKLAETMKMIEKEYNLMGGRKRVEVIFYTIDGVKVIKKLKCLPDMELKSNCIYLKLNQSNQVMVNICDSKTVGDFQIEYPVIISQLQDLSGFQLVESGNRNLQGYLISPDNKNYFELFTYGKMISHNLGVKSKRLPLDMKKGVIVNGKTQVKGDDKLEKFQPAGENYYRVATMNENISIAHSILKLTNEEYRGSDLYKRRELARDLARRLRGIGGLKDIAKLLELKIIVYSDMNKREYGEGDKIIQLTEDSEKTFEPIIKIIDGEKIYYTK